MTKASLSVLGMLTLAAACGGGDDESDTPVLVNTGSAGSAVTTTAQVTGAIGSSDGGTAAGSLYSLGASASAIVTPDYSAQARVVGQQRGVTGTCDCDPSGCTFVACSDESGTWSVDGTIGISGDTYTFDVDMAFGFQGQTWDWAYDGEVTASASELDGSLDGEGHGTFSNPNDGSTIDFDWSWGVDYNGIGLDGSGCPTSGSLDASVSYDVSAAQGGAASYSGSGHVDFGPTCGAATGS